MTTLFDLKDNTVLLLGGFGFMAGTIGPELEKAGATIIVGDKKKNKTHPLAKNPYYHVNATSPASLQKCREKMRPLA